MSWIEATKSTSGTLDGNIVMGTILHKGNVDLDGDIIALDAKVDLSPLIEYGHVFLNHDRKSLPIGIVSPDTVKDMGDRVEGGFEFLEHPAALAAKSWYEARQSKGLKTGLSVGMRHRNAEYKGDNRIIKDIQVMEWSVVTYPANPLALTKSFEGVRRADAYEHILSNTDQYLERLDKLASARGADWHSERCAELMKLREMVDKAINTLTPLDEETASRIRNIEAFASELK